MPSEISELRSWFKGKRLMNTTSQEVYPTSIVSLLYLSGFTVDTGEQQPGGLPHVVAVHGEAPAMLGVGHRHPDPLHQRRQYQERPAGGKQSCFFCSREMCKCTRTHSLKRHFSTCGVGWGNDHGLGSNKFVTAPKLHFRYVPQVNYVTK